MTDQERARALRLEIAEWIDGLFADEVEVRLRTALSAARQEERERVYRECSDVARRRGADEVADILRSAANIEQGRAAAIRARGEAGQ
jgi:rubrerythrin